MYKRIYVTGASGFVGQNLISYLLQDHHDLFEDIVYRNSKMCNLTVGQDVYTTIRSLQPDCIIHLAAVCGGIGANAAEPGRFMQDNLAMGLNLINAAKDIGCVKKFINMGTICAYPKFAPIPFKEKDIWNGYPEETNAPYGIAKKALTELLIAYNKQYGFNSVNLYPTNMYGPHDHFNLDTSHVIPAIILKVHQAQMSKQNTIELWGTGKATRDFLYVEDCCRAIKSALEYNTGPQPINIGTDSEYSIKEIANRICFFMKYDGEIVWNHSKPDGQPRRCVSTNLATQILGYEATTSIDSGLEKTIKWFKENNTV